MSISCIAIISTFLIMHLLAILRKFINHIPVASSTMRVLAERSLIGTYLYS